MIVIKIYTILSIVCSIFLAADLRSDEKNDSAEKTQEKQCDNSSKVKELRSNLGIRFLFMNDDSAPLVHVRVAFKYSGSAYMERAKCGLPDFYSEAVFCGCDKYTKVQFKKKLKDIMALGSCYANGDSIVFSITFPKIVLQEAASLTNAALNKPTFEKNEVKRIQDSIVGSLQSYDWNPRGFAECMFLPAIVFKSHPYETYYGSVENFAMLSIDDLRKYKTDYLVVNNAEACVFGDISENEAKDLLDRIFRNVPKGVAAKDTVSDTKPLLKAEEKVYYEQSPQSTIVFAMKTERHNSANRYVAAILNMIFGGGMFKSRIMSILRSKEGLIYRGGAGIVHMNHVSYITGLLETDNSKVKKAIESIKKIIKDLRKNGITNEDLEFAKSNIKGSILVGMRTSDDLCGFYFREMLLGNGVTALKDLLDGINNVKLKEVNDLARKILDENNIPFVIIAGNKDD
ncbi:hypothetical protein FACS189472_04690 [Alphaproteobacteria bacterium]|nr:hypothetical protein FACS189472_04690 [Alphaproteobacteria bacterium]